MSQPLRNCYQSPPTYYVLVSLICVFLLILILVTVVGNKIFKVKSWLNKYDNLSMNVPGFLIYFEVYM